MWHVDRRSVGSVASCFPGYHPCCTRCKLVHGHCVNQPCLLHSPLLVRIFIARRDSSLADESTGWVAKIFAATPDHHLKAFALAMSMSSPSSSLPANLPDDNILGQQARDALAQFEAATKIDPGSVTWPTWQNWLLALKSEHAFFKTCADPRHRGLPGSFVDRDTQLLRVQNFCQSFRRQNSLRGGALSFYLGPDAKATLTLEAALTLDEVGAPRQRLWPWSVLITTPVPAPPPSAE
eukprot:m.48335 g.48335  ORF g.48335 m.48335 type:complete len:237 (+) comp11990_c0_seq2:113-823(+)